MRSELIPITSVPLIHTFSSHRRKKRTAELIPFLDTCLHVNEEASTKDVDGYRKPTYTDQYLNYQLRNKRAAVNTLLLRAQTLVSEEDEKVKEIQHVTQALKANNHPDWIVVIPKTG